MNRPITRDRLFKHVALDLFWDIAIAPHEANWRFFYEVLSTETRSDETRLLFKRLNDEKLDFSRTTATQQQQQQQQSKRKRFPTDTETPFEFSTEAACKVDLSAAWYRGRKEILKEAMLLAFPDVLAGIIVSYDSPGGWNKKKKKKKETNTTTTPTAAAAPPPPPLPGIPGVVVVEPTYAVLLHGAMKGFVFRANENSD